MFKKIHLAKFIYLLFTKAYLLGIRIVSTWNPKARRWISGRKQFPALPGLTVQPVWMHCASLGEFEQGRPLLEAIRVHYPEKKIIVTFFSPSGFEVVSKQEEKLKNAGQTPIADNIFYLPMDSQANAKRFINNINPALVIWVKYEFWFFYLDELRQRKIPVLMICGLFRESQPFFHWYGSVWKRMLGSFSHFFVQTEDSIQLLNSIGISGNITLDGDTRFDRVIAIAEQFEPIPSIELFCNHHKVVVVGSSWEEDEEELVHFVKINPDIRFIIAPHEIDETNIKEVRSRFPGAVLFSDFSTDQVNTTPLPNVLIINNIGMLSRIYHYADIAFVGGGFVEDGIHNVLEAAVYGKPVLHGPAYEKFAEAADLVALQACIPVNNALEVEQQLNKLFANEALRQQKGATAKAYVYSMAGATAKIMDHIQAKRLLTN